MPAKGSSTIQSMRTPGSARAASLTAGPWCTTSPSEEVLTKSIVFIGYNEARRFYGKAAASDDEARDGDVERLPGVLGPRCAFDLRLSGVVALRRLRRALQQPAAHAAIH